MGQKTLVLCNELRRGNQLEVQLEGAEREHGSRKHEYKRGGVKRREVPQSYWPAIGDRPRTGAQMSKSSKQERRRRTAKRTSGTSLGHIREKGG